MKRIRGKLSYANVISTLALFLVLAGGTALAAKQVLPKNSVGTKQVKNNAITGAKIKNGAVTGAKIAPGSITGSNINSGSLGTVPNATHAATADHANSADQASSATRANSANSADIAGNSNTLQGMPAAAFAKSSAAVSGAAKYAQPTPQTILSLPEAEIATKAGGNGSQLIFKVTGTDRWDLFRQSVGFGLNAPTTSETEINPLFLERFFLANETKKIGWSITCLDNTLASEDFCTAAGG